MALSIGRLGGMSIQAQHYSLGNQSNVSSAYKESMQQASGAFGASVTGAHPVQYPTAQLTDNRIAQIKGAQHMEQAYNAIASSFDASNTSYRADKTGANYSAAGANIDLFA